MNDWTSDRVAAALLTLEAWLADTRQDAALADLRSIVVNALGSADAVTLGELIDATHALGEAGLRE